MKNLIKPLNAAPRDPGRRITLFLSVDIHNAITREMRKRAETTGVRPTLRSMVEDALIAHYEIGMEEMEME